jgi:hypothetical protein
LVVEETGFLRDSADEFIDVGLMLSDVVLT